MRLKRPSHLHPTQILHAFRRSHCGFKLRMRSVQRSVLGMQRFQVRGRFRRQNLQLIHARQQFRALTLATRLALNQLYTQATLKEKVANDGESIEVSALKIKAYEQFRSDYAALKARSGLPAANWRGYDDWVAHANNAAFGAMAAYDEGVPAFERLFVQNGSDWSRFFNAVEALAKLSKPQRDAALQQE